MLKTAADFREHLASLGVDLPFDETVATGAGAPLAQPYRLPDGTTVGNRFCDPAHGRLGRHARRPAQRADLRRWRALWLSGAKLIWGGEAVAVRHDGRANPNQLMISERHAARPGPPARDAGRDAPGELRPTRRRPAVGLQLTHSGRFCRPNDKKRLEPLILYHHPLLDRKFGLPAGLPGHDR